MNTLACSVIIPSYNRRTTLAMVLEGLACQTLAQVQFEVIVVLDGSTDDSAAMLADWQRQGRIANLRWHQQPNSGQATARNTGVALAHAPIVVLLDDDVVPEPDLLAAHLRWHSGEQPLAVLGDCLIVRERLASLYHLGVWAWWEDLYHQRAQPGRQPGCRDFCAGNVSLRRADFLATGGFDTDFRGYGGEDYELGYRLLQAGVHFVADRSARAKHYHRTTVAGVLRTTRQQGHGDVLLGQKHPALRSGLGVSYLPDGQYGLLVRVAMLAPALGDRMIALMVLLLPLLEALRLRGSWQKIFGHARGYVYWRGVRDAVGSWQALRAFQRRVGRIPEQQIDIEGGVPERLPPITVEGQSLLHVTYGNRVIGTLHLRGPIFTPLHAYLAEQIASHLGDQVLAILSTEGIIDASQHPWLVESPPIAA